jgi:phosphoribosyl-ATP pyrophosphohydrolase
LPLLVNTLAIGFDYHQKMSDSLERLYQAVVAAKDLDPAVSRTARLFRRGPEKMAKKLAEEAVEVVIDAVNGKSDAVVRESADLLYNLTVLWVSAGIQPEDVWREMERREHLLGIAEKLPKSALKLPKVSPPQVSASQVSPPKVSAPKVARQAARRPIVALESRSLRKRH